MTQIQFRRDTSTNFTSVNPVLASGEPAFETDTGKFKIGDGTTAYNSLEYIGAGDIPDNITTQGNTFNGANQLVQLDASGKLPAVDGSQLTNLSAATAPANMVTTDTNQIISGVKDFSTSFKTNNGISLRGSITARDRKDGINPTIINYQNGAGNIILGETEQYTHSSMMKNVGIEIRQNNISNDAGLYAHKGTDVYPLFDSSNIPTGALKYWTGTEAAYTALGTKDADTLYRLTDTNKVYLGTIQLGGS